MGAFEVACDPAIDAEIDERGERPDLFRFDEAAEGSGDGADGEIDGETPELAVQHSGDGEGDAASHGGEGAEEDSEQDGGFEADVGGEEVGDADADPDTENERNTDERDQFQGLTRGAMGEEEEVAEGFGTGQRARYRCRDAELNQQRDEDERVGNGLHQ